MNLQAKWISYLHFDWLPDNHSAFTLWNKVSHKKTRDFLAISWKNGLKKTSFLSEIWRIMKNDQPSSNLELPLLCTIWNICIYIIFWNIIYSLREMNSTTMWGGWCIPFSFGCLVGFVSFAISFSLGEEDTRPCENPTWHSTWKASCRRTPGIWGILTILSQELPSVSTWWPKEAHRLLYCFLPCAILACKLGLHNHTLYSIDI